MPRFTQRKRRDKNIKPDLYFTLSDGRPIKSLLGLADSLEDMADEVFKSHVNKFKNDFSQWIRVVFKDNDLADKLMHEKSKQRHQIIILRHLAKGVI